MTRWFGILGLAFCVGCATVVVRPYVSRQQNWPMGPSGIVSTGFGMPVFASPPPQPYDVMAELRMNRPSKGKSAQSDLPAIVKKAKAMGADALMYIEPYKFFANDYGARTTGGKRSAAAAENQFRPDSFEPGGTFLAIKWVTLPVAPASP
jgi:hypothetical protein